MDNANLRELYLNVKSFIAKIMKTARNLIALLGIGGCAFGVGGGAAPKLHSGLSTRHRIPVLVELFTSEGCSSCPSADVLLGRLQSSQPLDNALIVPLGEHVDYWDGPSWKDRFSTHENSLRQLFYARHFHLDGPYTPQLVVNGETELLGSDENSALEAISVSAGHKRASIALTSRIRRPNEGNIHIEVSGLDQIHTDHSNAVFLAVIEDNLDSSVKGGENDGRVLHQAAVMRRLVRIGDIASNSAWSHDAVLPLDPQWKRKDLQVVVFIQGAHTGHIFGTALCGLGEK